MWWTAPAPGDESPYGDRLLLITSGSRPHANYHDRIGYRQERVPGSRDRREREGGCQEATSPQPGDCVFQGFAAMPSWDGGLCLGALLGTRVEEVWSRGAFDAGEGRQGLRQAQQERCGRRGSEL